MSTIPQGFSEVPVALLYSFSQNCFHIEDVNQTSRIGMRSVIMDEPCDWIVLGFARTHKEASELLEQIPRPTPYPKRLVEALAAEWMERQRRFHCREEGASA